MDDFVPIQYRFPRENITIYPIADLHYGTREFNEPLWCDFKRKLLKEDKSYIVFAGDMLDMALKSSKSDTYQQTKNPQEQVDWLAEQLKELKDKTLAIVPGNHEKRPDKESGLTPVWNAVQIAGLQDVYRPSAAYVILRFGNPKNNGLQNPTYTICIMHGSGGVVNFPNKQRQYATQIDGLDLMVAGHAHDPALRSGTKIVLDPQNNKVSLKPFEVVICSAWTDYAQYAREKQYSPNSFRAQKIELYGKRKNIEIRSAWVF